MTIQIGGHTFSSAEVIAAIQASDNQTVVASPYQNLDELGGIMQAVLHRLTALENRLPEPRVGYGVTTTTADGVTTYRVQTTDHHGETLIVTFEYPETT